MQGVQRFHIRVKTIVNIQIWMLEYMQIALDKDRGGDFSDSEFLEL
jgi:hypothetical protein